MKNKERLQLRVGVFIFFVFLLAVVVVFTIGDQKNIFSPQFSIYCYFEEISGLRIGAPVYLAGVSVGQVDNIRFSEDPKDKKVEVRLSINRSHQDRIRGDSKASIQSQGILGDKLIFMSVGSVNKPIIQDGGMIQAETLPSFDDFIDKGSELLDNLNLASRKINDILGTDTGDKTVKDLSSITQSLRNILNQIENGQGLAHELIYDPEGKQVVNNVSGLTASVQHIFQEIEIGDGMLHNIIYDKKDDKVSNNLAETSRNIRITTENFREISDKIRSGEGSLGGLVNDPTVYYDLKTLLGKANRNKLLRAIIRSTLHQKEDALLGNEKE